MKKFKKIFVEAIAPLPHQKTEEDRKGVEAQSKIVYTGFVAQEVEAAAKKIGSHSAV